LPRNLHIHDFDAEKTIISSIAWAVPRVLEVTEDLDATDFYMPRNQVAWAAFSEYLDDKGYAPDAATLLGLVRLKPTGANVEWPDLFDMDMPAIRRDHVETVKRYRATRDVMAMCSESLKLLTDGENPFEVAEDLDHFISSLGSTHANDPESLTYWEFAETSEAEAPVIIPGLMWQDWRIILVAGEGVGKAVLMRTLAQNVAQGMHPLLHHPITPHRTLLVDLENTKGAVTETSGVLEQTLATRVDNYQDDMFRIWHRQGGMDIRNRQDRADLQREIAFQKPKLVCIGPLYKMFSRHPGESYEEAADDVLNILDKLRTKYGFALVIEHHAAKGQSGSKRALDPMGSQRWMAWPEMNIALEPEEGAGYRLKVDVKKSRLRHFWPDHLDRDGQWLFTGCWDQGVPEFLRKGLDKPPVFGGRPNLHLVA
jgi:hypothetical protein